MSTEQRRKEPPGTGKQHTEDNGGGLHLAVEGQGKGDNLVDNK